MNPIRLFIVVFLMISAPLIVALIIGLTLNLGFEEWFIYGLCETHAGAGSRVRRRLKKMLETGILRSGRGV